MALSHAQRGAVQQLNYRTELIRSERFNPVKSNLALFRFCTTVFGELTERGKRAANGSRVVSKDLNHSLH